MAGPVRGRGSARGRGGSSREESTGARGGARRGATRGTGSRRATGSTSRAESSRGARATGRRQRVASKSASPLLVYGGAGGAVLLVIIVAIFLMSGNKGGDEPEVDTGAETSAIPEGTGPTKAELDEGQRLYREALKLVESAESMPDKAQADKLRLEARELLDRATGIWDAAMARITEDRQSKYTQYEEDYVRQWALLKRRTQIVK